MVDTYQIAVTRGGAREGLPGAPHVEGGLTRGTREFPLAISFRGAGPGGGCGAGPVVTGHLLEALQQARHRAERQPCVSLFWPASGFVPRAEGSLSSPRGVRAKGQPYGSLRHWEGAEQRPRRRRAHRGLDGHDGATRRQACCSRSASSRRLGGGPSIYLFCSLPPPRPGRRARGAVGRGAGKKKSLMFAAPESL